MTLPALLWTALDGLERAYIATPHAPGVPSLDLWANLLRVLDGRDTACKQLFTSLRLSKRAVRTRVSAALRKGWISAGKPDERQKSVRLTQRGLEASAWWKSTQCDIDKQWLGNSDVSYRRNLRAGLETVVAQLPLELPHYPAGYGVADASVTGGNGRDWQAVVRKPGGAVSALPISALLSQVIVAFAMSYEERSPVAFALSTTILKQVPAEGQSLRKLFDSVGVSALQRHGFLTAGSDSQNEFVRLTPLGRSVSDAYDEQVEAVERRWRLEFGLSAFDELHRALLAAAEILKGTPPAR